MRTVTPETLVRTLSALPQTEPRIVTSGNAATHLPALGLLDGAVDRYRLFLLNAPTGVPDREGVVLETPFLGPGQRDQPGLEYLPARLSLVPTMLERARAIVDRVAHPSVRDQLEEAAVRRGLLRV